jgi:hypothetical protein
MGVHFQTRLRKALVEAFVTQGELAILVFDAWGELLQNIATLPNPYPNIVLEVISKNQGDFLKIGKLLSEARRKAPSNARLRVVAWMHALWTVLPQNAAGVKAASDVYHSLPRDSVAGRLKGNEHPLEDLAWSLADQPSWNDADGVPHVPLFDFVELLARRIPKSMDKAAAKPLYDWLDAAFDEPDWTDDYRERLRHGLRQFDSLPTTSDQGYLILRVEPLEPPLRSPEGKPLYGVMAWLDGTEHDCTLLAESQLTVEELPKTLSECRDELAKKRIPLENIQVELILPRSLRGHGIDQWLVAEALDEEVPLGTAHPLVVRCLERYSGPSKDKLQLAMLRFKARLEAGDQPCRLIPALTAPAAPAHEALWVAGVRGGQALRFQLEHRTACCLCVLSEQPEAVVRDAKADLFNTLLRAGVPAILWARQPPDPHTNLQAEFCNLIDTKPLANVPVNVKEHRRANALVEEAWQERVKQGLAAGAAPWHLGRHLTVIWDDPRRLQMPDADDNNQFGSPTP